MQKCGHNSTGVSPFTYLVMAFHLRPSLFQHGKVASGLGSTDTRMAFVSYRTHALLGAYSLISAYAFPVTNAR